MSEQSSSISYDHLPNKVEGNYSSLGNRHTYLLDAEGKKRVISRAAFTERFEQPAIDDQLIKAVSGGDHTDEDNDAAYPPSAPAGHTWIRAAQTDGEGYYWKMEPIVGADTADPHDDQATFRPLPDYSQPSRTRNDDEHEVHFSNGGADLDSVLVTANPELHREYQEARTRFTTAHADARRAGLGFLAGQETEKSSWIKQARRKLGKRFSPNERERQEALRAFEGVYHRARTVAAAEYLNQTGQDGNGQLQAEYYLDNKEVYALEAEITEKKLLADRKRGLVRQKIAVWGGVALAFGAGGLTAFGERLSKGEHHIGYLAVAALSGAVIGYRAEKTSRESDSDYRMTMLNRMSDAAGNVWVSYHPKDNSEHSKNRPAPGETDASKERQASPLYAIERVTNAEQKRYITRLGKAAILGGVAASAGHILMDTGLNYASGLFGGGNHTAGNNEVKIGAPQNDATPVTSSPTVTETSQVTHQPTSAATTQAHVNAPSTIEATPAGTPAPTVESTPTPEPTSTPTVEPTSTPRPTSTPTIEPTATPSPTGTPVVETQTSTPTPEVTPEPASESLPVLEPQGGVDTGNSQLPSSEIPVTVWEPRAPVLVDITKIAHDSSTVVTGAAREIVGNLVPVEFGSSITKEIMQYAAKNDIKISPQQAYSIYCEYSGGTYIERLGQYVMPDGDVGIANPGMGVWNPDFKDFLDRKLDLVGLIDRRAA